MSGTPRAARTRRPGLALGLLFAACLTTGLGVWQLRRNTWKQAWLAEMTARLEAPPAEIAAALADPNAFAFRRVVAEGTLLPAQSILVDHQSLGPHEGSHVVTPLDRGPGTPLLLVDRGFVSFADADRFAASESARAAAAARIEGALEPLEREALAASDPAPAARVVHWNRLHLGALERQLGRPVEAALLVRAPQPGDTEPLSALPQPKSRVDHMEYALTWFAIAGIALVIAAYEWRRSS